MTSTHRQLRNLNAYESMLATSTCNVGMDLLVPAGGNMRATDDIDSILREAWLRCVAERRMLQVRLVACEDNTNVSGKSGPGGGSRTSYALALIDEGCSDAGDTTQANSNHERLFVIQHNPDDNDNRSSDKKFEERLLRDLQLVGTTALDIFKGSYHVRFTLNRRDGKDKSEWSVQMIISLCHALSDGPGALRVARSFLQHLGDVLDGVSKQKTTGIDTSSSSSTGDCSGGPPLPLTDLQELILGGDDYAVGEDPKPVFEGQEEFVSALACKPPRLKDGTIVLPPEFMQNIPSDPGFGGSAGFIDCVHISLSTDETAALRLACRQHGTTVQGALNAAALTTRVSLLDPFLVMGGDGERRRPVHAAIQVPVNTRSIAGSGVVDPDECLCGSAGIWYTARANLDDKETMSLWSFAKRSTESIRSAMSSQPREWLRRLFHAPATLPPYSFMVSSIGVAPIEATYGNVSPIKVERVLFFGGALRTEQPSRAVGTMLHAVTFKGEFNCLINWTSPGVAKSFAEDTARIVKSSLLSMISESGPSGLG